MLAAAALSVGPPAAAVSERSLHATVSVSKTGSGTVTSSPGGINCGSICAASFPSTDNDDYQPIDLTATPNPGWEFGGWGGACSGTGGCTIDPLLQNEGQSVSATFTLIPQPNYPVSVGKSGSGTVTSSPAGIDCGSSCSASFDTGSGVTLSASPAAGWTFGGWSGDCSGGGACSLTIDAPKSVNATFNPPPPADYPLAVGRNGDGTVTSSPAGINCADACAANFPTGSTVTLSAVPAPGTQFSSWGGDCSGTVPTCSLTMGGPKSVTATFGAAPVGTLPLAVSRSGQGTVTSSPPGIDCGATCSNVFALGSRISLTATPAAGWRFVSWGGSCAGTSPTCVVTLSTPQAVTAAFEEIPATYPVAVTTSGTGSVTSTPAGISCGATCSASFGNGASIRLRAAAQAGWQFAGWRGACTGRAATCALTMDGPKAVSASFARRSDQTAPKLRALASVGTRGKSARLRYRVTDNSGKSREWASVYRGKTQLATVRSPLDSAEPGVLYYFLTWKVPKTLPRGLYRFCVRAADAAGNLSKASCAGVRVL